MIEGNQEAFSENSEIIGRKDFDGTTIKGIGNSSQFEIPSQSLALPKLGSVNSSPCESFCSIQIDGELSVVSEGEENNPNPGQNGTSSPSCRPSTSLAVRRYLFEKVLSYIACVLI